MSGELVKLKHKYRRNQIVKRVIRQASGGSGNARGRLRNNHVGCYHEGKWHPKTENCK